MIKHKIIAIDLDGTLYSQDGWRDRNLGKLMKGAVKELRTFKNDGWEIIIHTARSQTDINDIELRLISDGVPYDRIWRGKGKPLADVYLDDRGITFTGSWEGIFQKVNTWQPWSGPKFLRPPTGSEFEELYD
jgi:hypothetical protein